MVMPADPAPRLVFVEAAFSFAALKVLFDAPAATADFREPLQGSPVNVAQIDTYSRFFTIGGSDASGQSAKKRQTPRITAFCHVHRAGLFRGMVCGALERWYLSSGSCPRPRLKISRSGTSAGRPSSENQTVSSANS